MKSPSTHLTVLLLAGTVALSLQGCSKAPSSQTEATHEEQHAKGEAHEHPEEAAASASEFIKIGAYQFKLSPEIMKDGETHLDFFVQDAQGQHAKGVTGVFHITKPNGSKESIPVTEEAGTHYHGLLHLTEYGQYQVVAQLKIGEESFNPRFSFERKE